MKWGPSISDSSAAERSCAHVEVETQREVLEAALVKEMKDFDERRAKRSSSAVDYEESWWDADVSVLSILEAFSRVPNYCTYYLITLIQCLAS